MAQDSKVGTMITEPSRDIKVVRETDVVVVGGGPGGVAAAMAAGRNGVKTVLVERYGHLGGMATGGLVLMMPQPFAGDQWRMPGICQEWIDRLDENGGGMHPGKDEVGSDDEKVIDYWGKRLGWMSAPRVGMTVWFDPELLKCACNDMVEDAGVHLYLHSWGVRPVMEGRKVKGVIFESKSGRQAILAKVTIDATGDGDIFAEAGCGFDFDAKTDTRASQLALVFRIGNVDFEGFNSYRYENRNEYNKLMVQMTETFPDDLKESLTARNSQISMPPFATAQDGVVWVNNWIKDMSCLNVDHLTWVEVNMRKAMRLWHKFYKENCPGFENSFMLDTAPQLGTRGSRRLHGEYTMTKENMNSTEVHDDTIVVYRSMTGRPGEGGDIINVCKPYRVLIPRDAEGILAAGRCFSSDLIANNRFNLIPHCIAMGQGAGTGAAIAVKDNVEPREINHLKLRRTLIDQGVYMPGVE